MFFKTAIYRIAGVDSVMQAHICASLLRHDLSLEVTPHTQWESQADTMAYFELKKWTKSLTIVNAFVCVHLF